MSNRATITKYSYHGPFGEVSHSGRDYFAWQDGHLIGTYQTFEKAMEQPRVERKTKDKTSRLKSPSGISMLDGPVRLDGNAGQMRRAIFAESSLAMSIPRSVSRIESEISPRSFSRLSERLSDVRAAFALSGPAVALSITSHLCP
jgi:hypothetical protein